MVRTRRFARRFLGSRRGGMSVEAALVFALLLVPMMLGLWEGSRLLAARSALSDALTAAVSYLVHRAPERPAQAELQQVARAAVGRPDLMLTVSDLCTCASPAGTGIVHRACSAGCAAGTVPAHHLWLEVARDVTVGFPISLVKATLSLRSHEAVRVE